MTVETAAPAAQVALERDLRARVDGEVRFDAGSRAAYSTDAGNFRHIPIGVVVPRSVDAAVAAVAVCREHDAPVLSRGGGTSLAGQASNVAVVIDWSKHCNRLVSLDVDGRTCVVEPGIVLDRLQDQLREHGLMFGPEPATHDHCTLGGMVGNNSCGATAQSTGKTVDNVVRLEVLLYDGTRTWVGRTTDEEYDEIVAAGGRRAEVYRALRALRDEHLADVRTQYPDIPRRVSGYNLDSLLPENGFHVARALVGSEGTLVTVLHAELTLLPRPRQRSLVVLGCPTAGDAGDAVPAIDPHQPIALEGLDRRLLRTHAHHLGEPDVVSQLPTGEAFLMVRFGGATQDEADARVDRLLGELGKSRDDGDVFVPDTAEAQEQLWTIRESALGTAARLPDGRQAWEGWEDSAVPPDRLGDYLRDLERLFADFGYGEVPVYGHFGHGCIHLRVPFDLETADGVATYRRFMESAADLCVSYGGSLSGEHGDGQQRGELLPRMYGPDVLRAFRQLRTIFDPGNRMNPDKLVQPLDGDLRLGVDYRHDAGRTFFAYPEDGGFEKAVLRCVGVGKCRREGGDGVMCPSYMVTREEEHSTRGRARLLFEMLDGTPRGGPIADGWRSEAVHDALDLCLACKGCKSDCPVNVDMATYKAEFLAHHYKGRLRPRAHYAMGWLPVWAAAAAAAPDLVNTLARTPGLSVLAKRAAGVDPHRELPRFAHESFQRWYAHRGPRGDGRRGEVVLWPDTFSNRLSPTVARSAVEVLEDAGWRVVVPDKRVCCGLTWISTGQLAIAARVLKRTLSVLSPYLRRGTPVVGLEPSCTAVFRSDASDLLPHDAEVRRLREQTVTLAELLHSRTPGWSPPRVDVSAVVQTHCHQHAVLGFDADRAVLAAAGVDADVLDSGCCGLAGNFGFEAGHYDVSMALAERVLLPAVRDAAPTTRVLADGFSCRTQVEQADTGGRRAVHLAELLAEGLHRQP